MSELSRREVIRRGALSLTALGAGALLPAPLSRERYGSVFLEATEADRSALLDQLAAGVIEEDPGYEGIVDSIEHAGFRHYTAEPAGTLGSGIRFFSWMRRLVVDAFYTSQIGMMDVGYQGNEFLRRFSVAQEPLQYALRRSPFRER